LTDQRCPGLASNTADQFIDIANFQIAIEVQQTDLGQIELLDKQAYGVGGESVE